MAVEVINTRYEVLESISASDIGPYTLYKARDVQEGRLVALKVVPPSIADEVPDLVSYLKSAVRSTAALTHPMVSRVYDAGQLDEGGGVYLASDYVRGLSLRERIRRIAPFSLAVSTDIAVAVAEALTAAHRAGIVHGRLVPECIILSPEGQIRVSEFVAGRYLRDILPNAEGMSAPYRPPEASFEEESVPVDDIYALGAILYEMMTGVQPAASHGDLPTSPRTLNPAIPPALEGIALKALHPDTTIRYEDAASLLADLQAARTALRAGRVLTWSPLAGVDVTKARNATPPRDFRKRARQAEQEYDDDVDNRERRSPGVLAIAVRIMIVLVLCVAGYLGWFFVKFTSPPPDVAVPNLVGRTLDDARIVGKERHFQVVDVKDDFSTKWPATQIYAQDPPAGRSIKAGKQVSVYVSEGPQFLTVPDIHGMTEERALQALKDSFLQSARSEEFNETVPKGVIVSQNPTAKSNVSRFAVVNYVVSMGKQPPDTPGNVVANPTGPNRVEITWDAAPRALTYNVTRIVDGNLSVVGTSVKELKFDDSGLQPNTSYSYTITAVNAVGESAPTDPYLAITPPGPESGSGDGSTGSITETPGTTTDTGSTTSTPDATTSGTSQPATPDNKKREFHIAFRLPRHPRGDHNVRVEVIDGTGTSVVYDEMHHSGGRVRINPVYGIGPKVTVRIYVDDALMKQQIL